jgi:hypothetical protein
METTRTESTEHRQWKQLEQRAKSTDNGKNWNGEQRALTTTPQKEGED